MTTVTRTYGVGDFRFRYTLRHNGKAVKRILTDSEAMYAIVSGRDLELRRSASEISSEEINCPDTHIVSVKIN